MNKALEHIDAAYAWLSKVPVSGEGVDFWPWPGRN